MSVKQWAIQAAEVGLDAIDLSILFFKDKDPSYFFKIGSEIRTLGIELAILNTYPDLTHPNASERRKQLSQLEKDIAIAKTLGAKMVRVTAGQAHPETSRKYGIRWAIDGLMQSLDIANDYGIKLVYENHSKPGCWDYPDFSHPSDIFLEIVKGITGTNIGVLFDTANPIAYGDDPLPLLEEVIDIVTCIHAADTKRLGALEPVPLGTGLVPFLDIFNTLKLSGFNGLISIEEASGLGKHGVVNAVEYIRKVWENAKEDNE
ncbi:MAG: TIM barrel protein [Spirochaetota bacterium]|nr:MAG: TIM barrel protein [Spirochaetota bacterium]